MWKIFQIGGNPPRRPGDNGQGMRENDVGKYVWCAMGVARIFFGGGGGGNTFSKKFSKNYQKKFKKFSKNIQKIFKILKNFQKY